MNIKAFIKRIFGNDDKDIYWNPYEPDPKPEPTTLKDIGEPVIAFLRIFEATPKRFKLTKTGKPRAYYSSNFNFLDKVTGESWDVKIYSHDSTRKLVCDKLNWMTDDEQEAVITTIATRHQKRLLVRAERKTRNYNRMINRERSRLMEVYQ